MVLNQNFGKLLQLKILLLAIHEHRLVVGIPDHKYAVQSLAV